MEKVNVYQMVTDRIIEQLENGIIPWRKPWTGASLADGGAINYVSRKPYSLLNQILLGREGEYLTFKQIKDMGGNIKKGAKSGLVVFFTKMRYKKEMTDADGKEIVVEYTVPLLRYYRVFHIEDCEGIESKVNTNEPADSQLEPIEEAEKIIGGYLSRETKLSFQNDRLSNRAYYSPVSDTVVVPKLSQYDIIEEYYSTVFHELTHSTMPAYRCDRKSESGNIAAFGNEEYSREELVAELGSAMLCNAVGIDCDKAFKNSVAYIQGWLKHLKNDNKMIIWASTRAEKAAKYIIGDSI